MEAVGRSVGTADDNVTSNGGKPASAARGGGGGSPAAWGRGVKSTVRHISVAPAPSVSDDDVPALQSTEDDDTMQCSWRPMKPGYAVNAASGAVLIERTVKVEDFDHDDDTDNSFHLAIPTMSLSVAVICAVCNVISPGLGQFNFTHRAGSRQGAFRCPVAS